MPHPCTGPVAAYAAALKGAALCGPPCRGEFSKERNREAEGLGRRLTCESRLRGFAAPEKPARDVVSRRTAWRLLNRRESGMREDGAGSGLLNVMRKRPAEHEIELLGDTLPIGPRRATVSVKGR